MSPINESNATDSADNTLTVITDGESTSGLKAGVTSDYRLKVDALVSSVSVSGVGNVIYKSIQLLNGASKEMNVNGSGTPAVFGFTPASGETWYLEQIGIFVVDSGTMATNVFGSLGAALTNGLVLEIQSNGVAYEICNIKDNGDAATWFELKPSPLASGFSDVADSYWAHMNLAKNMVIKNSTSDYIRFRVRDNLTGVTFVRASVKMFRTI